ACTFSVLALGAGLNRNQTRVAAGSLLHFNAKRPHRFGWKPASAKLLGLRRAGARFFIAAASLCLARDGLLDQLATVEIHQRRTWPPAGPPGCLAAAPPLAPAARMRIAPCGHSGAEPSCASRAAERNSRAWLEHVGDWLVAFTMQAASKCRQSPASQRLRDRSLRQPPVGLASQEDHVIRDHAGRLQGDGAWSRVCGKPDITPALAVCSPGLLSRFFTMLVHSSWICRLMNQQLRNQILEKTIMKQFQGVHSICSALAFLHATAQLSHNNVCQRSLFCTSQGQWKLGGFELCRPFGQMSADVLKTVRTRLGDCAIDRDEVAYVFSADRRDSFDLYCLGRTPLDICDAIDASCSKLPDPQPQQQRRRQHLDQLRNLAKNCLCSASPTERNPAKRLQRHVAFSANCFTQLSGFLADFSLKSEDELRQFYVALKSRLRLGRLLLGRLPLTHPMAATYLLPYLLRPYRGAARPPDGDCLLSEANFQRELVPYLAMVLRIRDLPVRCALLEHFPAYCHLLDWA
uniref:Protein kinase domain-containing protein n=1 Tax=Macrostomum lignano TaxID=282301 RepID=A0A1I8FM84_9PLAT